MSLPPQGTPARPTSVAFLCGWVVRSFFTLCLVTIVGFAGFVGCTRGVRTESQSPPERVRGPAFLGVVYTSIAEGMGIVRVLPGSPAARAGILPGDVITEADGQPLAGHPSQSFHAFIQRKKAGTVVALRLLRGARGRALAIELDERPAGFLPGEKHK